MHSVKGIVFAGSNSPPALSYDITGLNLDVHTQVLEVFVKDEDT